MESPIVCPCTGLTENKLGQAIQQCGGVLDKIRRTTGMATHCTGCLPSLIEYLDDWHQKGLLPSQNSKKFNLKALWDSCYDLLIKIRRSFLIRRYAIFVMNTPIVKTRVAMTYLVPDETSKPIFPLPMMARLYDRNGKKLRTWFSLLRYPRTQLFNVDEKLGEKTKPFYGLVKIWMFGTPVTGSTRPYAYWITSDGIASTHDKFSYARKPTWKHTLVFIEVTPTYDTDLILSNPHNKLFSSEISLVADDGASLSLGKIEVPAFGTNLVCPLALNPESAHFLKGRRGSLVVENLDFPIMSYYLGHDLKDNKVLIQHL